MTEKDKAIPRQRQIMEQRWDDARKDCAAKTCNPVYRYHVAGCERRQQKVTVTNLNTGETAEVTTVKEAMDANEKQAVLLEPLRVEMDVPQEPLDAAEPGSGHYSYALPGVVVVKDVNDLTQDELDQVAKAQTEGGTILIPQEMHFEREYWDQFERGQRRELFEPRIQPRQEQRLMIPAEPDTSLAEPAPVRSWWKRVFGRG